MTAPLTRLRTELARCPFHDFLQPEAVSADDEGTVLVRLAFRREFRLAPDSDLFHGGVLAALVDITGHAAVAVRVGRVAPTIDLRIDYLGAAVGTELFATGRVLRAGSSIGRADVDVVGPDGRTVVCGRGTFSTSARPLHPSERGSCAP
jgi:uncharacterized protein (TIGR00369 family)